MVDKGKLDFLNCKTSCGSTLKLNDNQNIYGKFNFEVRLLIPNHDHFIIKRLKGFKCRKGQKLIFPSFINSLQLKGEFIVLSQLHKVSCLIRTEA